MRIFYDLFPSDFRITCEHPKLIVTQRAGQNHMHDVFQQLNELREAKILCDVNILVNDTVFPCHRNVLASTCYYFKAMFTHNFVEQNNSDVTLQGIEPNAFKRILDFMYTGNICIDHENVYYLLVTCEYLDLQFITDLCIVYLENYIPEDSIARICSFAVQKEYKNLIENALRPVIDKNFAILSKQLLNLSPVILRELLTPACVKSNTNEVVSFLSEWVKINRDTQFVFQLLKSFNDLNVCIDVSYLNKIMASMLQVEKCVNYTSCFEGQGEASISSK